MSYITVIAEKPSVAKELARFLGATTPKISGRANGYYEGEGYKVTWAFGHLVGLKSPEDMGFGPGILPMLPERWETDVIQARKGEKSDMDASVKKQLDIIDGLFAGSSKIIVATDAGREGELIFRYIYEHLQCKKPFERLWLSSFANEEIRKGFSNLRPGSSMDGLSAAAHARSEADWLVGYNASRALRISTGYKGILSLGRVQTPVLGMICDRFEANKNFVPTPFWQIQAHLQKGATEFPVLSETKYAAEKDAVADCGKVKGSKRLKVISVEKKTVTAKPPLLHDLTSLQRLANRRHGLTGDETLRAAQSLYEKKLLTYPRTGSCYITEEVFKEIPSLIRKVEGYDRFSAAARNLSGKKLCNKSVNSSKVTDHHALLPTANIPESLSGHEKTVWELVAGRLLEAFGENSLSDRTTIRLECEGIAFKTSGSVLVKAGWKEVFGVGESVAEEKKKDSGDEEPEAAVLPEVTEGEVLPSIREEVLQKTDKPLPIYTEDSLLGEMETCGKSIDDEELREAMKEVGGLGTSATRSATIELLIRRGYIVRTPKRKLEPTPLGQATYESVRGRRIASVKESAQWEHDLARVEKGEIAKKTFDDGIRRFVLEIIDDLKANAKPLNGLQASVEPQRTCPCCGKTMKNMKFCIMCDADSGGCGFKVSREIAGKKIPESAINAICEKGSSPLIKGFKSKSGKSFEARLRVDKEQKTLTFAFEDKPKGETITGRICPCCGASLEDKGGLLGCGCGFTLWKTQLGVALKVEQIDALLSGKAVHLSGMKGKSGKPFSGSIRINTDQKKIDLSFDAKKK